VGRFPADPPAGTPHAVIELLHLVTSDPAEFLPPRICFEAVLEAAPVLGVVLN